MPDTAMFTDYAHACLHRIPNSSKSPEKFAFRNRYTHTLRVMGWCRRLLDEIPAAQQVVLAAAALHDIGYAVDAQGHAAHGERMALVFLLDNGYDESFAHNVADLVGRHSDKHLAAHTMSNELIILQDADCLDEIGATTVLWDAMAQGALPEQSYEAAYKRIEQSYRNITGRNRRLKSALGQRLYQERFAVLEGMIAQLEYELFLA